MTKLRVRYLEDLRLRNYSTKTQKIYCDCVSHFARFFKQSPEELGPEHIREYQLYLINEKKSSWSYFNQTICALRFLYRETLGRDWVVNHLPFPRKQKKLPVVLSKDEVSQLLGAVGDPKYKAVLSMIYATGRRVSEAAHLQVAGLDSHRMLIRVREAKGNKDRYVVLSSALLEMLREYWKRYRPTQWLFPGATPDKPILADSLESDTSDFWRTDIFARRWLAAGSF